MLIERVIAATDFSEASRPALQRAVRIATEHRASLQLITIVPQGWRSEVRAWFAGTDIHTGMAAIRSRLQQTANELARDNAATIDTVVLEGDPRTEIAAHVNRVDAQLLVVGAHGRGLIGEVVLGSTALALLERCDAPILVVRKYDGEDYRVVLAGVDFEPAARGALEFAAALFPAATLSLVHAYQDPFAAELFLGQATDGAERYYRDRAKATAQDQFERFVDALGPLAARCRMRLAHGPPGLRLMQAAERQSADLIVLGSHRKGRLETALLGSVAANVAMMVRTDVLLVRQRQQDPPSER